MIDTGNESIRLRLHQHRKNGSRQIPGIRRRTNLVEHDRQLFPFISQTQHRLDKIIPELRVKPCRPDDYCIRAHLLQSLFTGKFRTPVDRGRTSIVRFHIRQMICAVKHIVGRNMDHPRPSHTCRLAQVPYGIPVDTKAKSFVILRLIHSRIGGTIDDIIDLLLLDKSLYGLSIADVKRIHIRKHKRILRISGS